MRKPSLIYLASPYSDPDPLVRQYRYEAVCRAQAQLIRNGNHVFCPIANGHGAGEDLPPEASVDFDYWRDFDFRMISLCDEMFVVKLPGWKESKGVTAEIEYAQSLGMEVNAGSLRGDVRSAASE